jgi:hypothetical protein
VGQSATIPTVMVAAVSRVVLKDLRLAAVALLLIPSFTIAAPSIDPLSLITRQSSNRLVFCHFMVSYMYV